MIYLDNAATTKPCNEAISALTQALEEYGNPSSAHTLGQNAAALLYTARKDVAQCIGAKPDEIFFTSCGSESDTMALISGAEYGRSYGKRHIISQVTEHHAVLNCLKALEKDGFEITLLPVDSVGRVSPEQLERAIRPDTALVSVMTANNEIGTIQPINEIGKICRSHGVLFHTDGVQAVGSITLDISCCDMLSFSAHKFHGVKGAGALYVRRNLPVTPIIYGGNQERGRRGGTENLAAICAMAAALKLSVSDIKKNSAYISSLRDRMIEAIECAFPSALLNGARDNRLSGNVSFCFPEISGEELVYRLSKRGIYCSSGSACSTGNPSPSHVIKALGRTDEQAKSAVRFSLSRYTAEAEITECVAALKEILSQSENKCYQRTQQKSSQCGDYC